MRQLFNLCFLNIFLCSCASIATKGDLESVSLHGIEVSKKKLAYRFYRVRDLMVDGVRVEADEGGAEHVGKVLRDVGLFEKVEKAQPIPEFLMLLGEDIELDMKRLLKLEFPIEQDYFLDVRTKAKAQSQHGNMYWVMLHAFTLGFIPVANNNDVHLEVTLYDKRGNVLSTSSVKNKSTVWSWTPLFFFNNFKLIQSFEDLKKPNREKVLGNVLKELELNKR